MFYLFIFYYCSTIGEGHCNQFFSVFLSCLSVLFVHLLALITQKLLYQLSSSGDILHGVQIDSSKYGKISLKIKVKRRFLLY